MLVSNVFLHLLLRGIHLAPDVTPPHHGKHATRASSCSYVSEITEILNQHQYMKILLVLMLIFKLFQLKLKFSYLNLILLLHIEVQFF